MPVDSDHFSANMSNVSLEHNSQTTDDIPNIDSEGPAEQKTLKPSKSDPSLNTRDKTPSLSSDEGHDLPSSKPTSRSNNELSSKRRTVPTHLAVENSILQPQLSYKVSPTRDGNVVPFTSYSSSEDEDEAEFFDADEFHESESAHSRSVWGLIYRRILCRLKKQEATRLYVQNIISTISTFAIVLIT